MHLEYLVFDMKLIWFLLIVVYTKVLISKKVSFNRMEKGLTTTFISKTSKHGVNSFSFEHKKKDKGKPVKTYPTLDVTLLARNKASTRGYSSLQEYVNTPFDFGPLYSNNSQPKFSSNSVKSETNKLVGKRLKQQALETPLAELETDRTSLTNIMKIPYSLSNTTNEHTETMKSLEALFIEDSPKKVST